MPHMCQDISKNARPANGPTFSASPEPIRTTNTTTTYTIHPRLTSQLSQSSSLLTIVNTPTIIPHARPSLPPQSRSRTVQPGVEANVIPPWKRHNNIPRPLNLSCIADPRFRYYTRGQKVTLMSQNMRTLRRCAREMRLHWRLKPIQIVGRYCIPVCVAKTLAHIPK